MIHIFTSQGQLHLDGHKELSKDEPIVAVAPEKIYIPAVDNKGLPLTQAVQVGAKVKKGSLLGVRSDFGLPVYSSVSGEVTAIVKLTSMVVGRPVNFFEITTVTGNEEEEKLQPLGDVSKENVVDKLKEGGIVGLGGAGFPSFIKYNTNDAIDTILVNAVECEPYLTTDYVVCEEKIEDAFLAFRPLLKASGADKVVIAVKKDKKKMIDAIEAAIAKNSSLPVVLAKVKDVYPMGWEKTLIKSALKRTYEGLPSKCGVIVNNLQTMIAIGRLFAYGEVVTSKTFTVSGLVAKPGNYVAPVGTMIKDLVVAAGGYSREKVSLLAGGPMTSRTLLKDDVPTLLATSGVTVLEPYIRRQEPCLRCGLCTDHCPANLQPVEIKDAAIKGDINRAIALKADACVECGLCSYVCPSKIQVTSQVSKMKLMINLKKPKAPAGK